MSFGKGITIAAHLQARKIDIDLRPVYDQEAYELADQFDHPEDLPPMLQAIPPGLSREVLNIMEEIGPRIDAIHPVSFYRAENLLTRADIEQVEGRRIDKMIVIHSILSGVAERMADVVWSDLSGRDIEDVILEEDQFRTSERIAREVAGLDAGMNPEQPSETISSWQLLYEQACKELGLKE